MSTDRRLIAFILAVVSLSVASTMQPAAGATDMSCARTVLAGKVSPESRVVESKEIDALESLSAKYGNQRGVRAVLPATNGATYLITSDAIDPGLVESAKNDSLVVVKSCVDDKTIESISAQVAASPHGENDFSSVGYNPYIDKIMVRSSIAESKLRSSWEKSGVELALQQSAIEYTQEKPGWASRALGARSADISPHYAGAQMRFSTSTGRCSSGFRVRSNVTLNYAMMTAGHCAPVGASVSNGNNTSSFGTVVFKTFPDPDLESIEGTSYGSRSFSNINDTTSSPVVGAADPALGVTYCELGAVGLRICTGYVTTNTSITDASGSTTNLAEALSDFGCPFGLLGRLADSGGPVVREVPPNLSARGLVVAVSPGDEIVRPGIRCARWDHKWSTIATIFNVSIGT